MKKSMREMDVGGDGQVNAGEFIETVVVRRAARCDKRTAMGKMCRAQDVWRGRSVSNKSEFGMVKTMEQDTPAMTDNARMSLTDALTITIHTDESESGTACGTTQCVT